jgi:8-oxo-dGTP diphosphatase
VARVPLSSPVPRAVAVVLRGDRVLVMKRLMDGQHYAVLPGGGIEDGESAEEAVLRELAEECTLTGTLVRRLWDRTDGDRDAHYFLADVPSGEPVLGGEELEDQDADNLHEPRWANIAELDDLGLLPVEVRPLVADLLR